MNKQMRIVAMVILALSTMNSMQIQAFPSFKKSAGLLGVTAGITYAWLKRDSIKKSVTKLKENPKKFFEEKFEDLTFKVTFLKNWTVAKFNSFFSSESSENELIENAVHESAGDALPALESDGKLQSIFYDEDGSDIYRQVRSCEVVLGDPHKEPNL